MHMAFLSRGFKNLQWYGMTNKKDAFRRLFYLAEMERLGNTKSRNKEWSMPR